MSHDRQLDLLGALPVPAPRKKPPGGRPGVAGDHVVRSAWFSDDKRYRMALTRIWKPGAPGAVVSGLNPSTADAFQDDPTIRSVSTQLDIMGYGALLMLNAFAFKATDPKDMLKEPDPVGRENDEAWERLLGDPREPRPLFIAAWGYHGAHMGRDLRIMDMLENWGIEPMCFGITMTGQPRHPLYLPHGTELKRYTGRKV